MAVCKIKNGVGGAKCRYSVAGCRALYLVNFYPPNVEGAEKNDKTITYTRNADGRITKIELPTGEKYYACKGDDNTISFTDVLNVNGGAKSRQHTVNATIGTYDDDLLAEADAISLGRFVAFVVDMSGNVVCLGRLNGLTATSFNYNSGAADADSSGWETVLDGVQGEVAPLLENEAVLDAIHEITITED